MSKNNKEIKDLIRDLKKVKSEYALSYNAGYFISQLVNQLEDEFFLDDSEEVDLNQGINTMQKFIEFFGLAHFNSMNIAAYENANGCLLIVENVVTGKELGTRQFDSYQAAKDWFFNLDGSNNLSRLSSAIELIC